jgi:N-acetylglucosaminyl-diphospho-decaprenol L-rhamnosyltransferase
MSDTRFSVVIATRNRAPRLLETLARLRASVGKSSIIVVDNASTDRTVGEVRHTFPGVQVIELERNTGAFARNAGVLAATTPYIAFCDDDAWWEPGALDRARALLDEYETVGLLNGRVLVGRDEHLDPACRLMAQSPLEKQTLCPGTAIGQFMAGAAMVRRDAFLRAGGFHYRFHIGGEEALLAVDLLSAGWQMIYCDDLVLHHFPSSLERDPARRSMVIRNLLWTAWLRYSLSGVLRSTLRIGAAVGRDADARRALGQALSGYRWIARERRRVAVDVESMVRPIMHWPP